METLEELREKAIQIFEVKVIKYPIGDLELLDSFQLPKFKYTCAIPTAMLIMSTLDLVGFLLPQKGHNKSATEKNISTSMTYGGYFPEYYSAAVIKDIVRIYRHGMMHSFFPNQNGKAYGIHKSQGNQLFEERANGLVHSMNVNVLSKDFKQFVNKLKEEFRTTENDSLLRGIIYNYTKKYRSTTSTTSTDTTIPF